MRGKIVVLATIGTVVALSIVAALLWVPQGPITFDEERYRKLGMKYCHESSAYCLNLILGSLICESYGIP